MKLPVFPHDKANHFIYGSAIFLVAYVAAHLGLRGPPDANLALLAVALFGVAKETADWLLNRRAVARGAAPPHGVQGWDAAATFVGGLVPWLVLFISRH